MFVHVFYFFFNEMATLLLRHRQLNRYELVQG